MKTLRAMLAVLTLLVANLAWGATYKVIYDFHDSAPGGGIFSGRPAAPAVMETAACSN